MSGSVGAGFGVLTGVELAITMGVSERVGMIVEVGSGRGVSACGWKGVSVRVGLRVSLFKKYASTVVHNGNVNIKNVTVETGTPLYTAKNSHNVSVAPIMPNEINKSKSRGLIFNFEQNVAEIMLIINLINIKYSVK